MSYYRNYWKQIIVLRKDLGLSKNKMILLASKASLRLFLSREIKSKSENTRLYDVGNWKKWLDHDIPQKIVYVGSELELISVYENAKREKVPCELTKENKDGDPVFLCCVIGPAPETILTEIV